ncbi:hypothetical protein WKS98_03390 [Lagierella sp. ICN-221743]
MSNFKFELNSSGVKELLKSDGIKNVINSHAQRIYSSLGDGYKVDQYDGVNRSNAMVWASSRKARKDNKKNNTLLKAIR